MQSSGDKYKKEYAVNQKKQVFGDKRTKRNRTRAAQKQQAMKEYR